MMVTVEVIRKSHKSRPRKAVVFWAFIGFLLAAGGLAFLLALKYVPTFLANLSEQTFNLMGVERDWRSFLIDFVLPAGQIITCFVAAVLCGAVASYRAFYLLFSIPSGFLIFAIIVTGLFNFLTPIHQFIPQIDMILKYTKPVFEYCAIGFGGLMTFFCFIALFYNHTYPLKYGRIYHLRKTRLRLAKSGEERHRVRRDFYKFYKECKAKELIGLLVEPYLPVDSELELIPEAFYYMKLNGGDANGEIKGYELEAARHTSEAEARAVYARTLEELEMAKNGDLSFLKRGETQIIYKPMGPAKPKPKPIDTRPINDPLWSPEEIH